MDTGGPEAEQVTIPIRVVPRASRTEIGGMRAGRLMVRVTAAPVDGKANKAAADFARGGTVDQGSASPPSPSG